MSLPYKLPRRLAEKIDPNDPLDPIALQFVPSEEENKRSPLYVADPVGDQAAQLTPKALQKYASRVLLVTTQSCAMHCRYCFRQNFPYTHERGFEEELARIRVDTTLREVILSGGDPLSLSDPTLKGLLEALETIPHLKRLRFHTRVPIGVPERITPQLLEMLSKNRLQTWFVIHCNHPRELDEEVLSRLQSIQKLGIPVLNQSVLLRHVNDSVEVLESLCTQLVDHGIQPYYLHQLDKVQGAERFEVSPERGRELIEELRKRVSGYAVPEYVQEMEGELSKTVL